MHFGVSCTSLIINNVNAAAERDVPAHANREPSLNIIQCEAQMPH
jgi:hypothetical protein